MMNIPSIRHRLKIRKNKLSKQGTMISLFRYYFDDVNESNETPLNLLLVHTVIGLLNREHQAEHTVASVYLLVDTDKQSCVLRKFLSAKYK